MEIEKRKSKLVKLPRENNLNIQYGTYDWIELKSMWVEITGVCSVNIPTTTTNYYSKISTKINLLIKKNYTYLNDKNLLIIDYSQSQLEDKGKTYYKLNLFLQPKNLIYWKDPEFQLVIKEFIDELSNYIINEPSFIFLESKLR